MNKLELVWHGCMLSVWHEKQVYFIQLVEQARVVLHDVFIMSFLFLKHSLLTFTFIYYISVHLCAGAQGDVGSQQCLL